MAHTLEELRALRGGISPSPTSTSQPAAVATSPRIAKQDTPVANNGDLGRGKYMTGSGLAKFFDVLSTPQYASAGLAHSLVKGENIFKGMKEGVQNRQSYSDVLGDMGVKNKYVKAIGGFAGDVLLDPTTYIGAGAVKGLLKKAPILGKGITKIDDAMKVENLIKRFPLLQNVGGLVSNKFRVAGNTDYLKALDDLVVGKSGVMEKSVELAKNLKIAPEDFTYGKYVIKKGQEIPEIIQKRIEQVLTGGITPIEGINKLTQPIKEGFENLANKSVSLGLADRKVFEKNYGKYLPSYYKKYSEGGKALSNANKLNLGNFKKRMSLEDWGNNYIKFSGGDPKLLEKIPAETKIDIDGINEITSFIKKGDWLSARDKMVTLSEEAQSYIKPMIDDVLKTEVKNAPSDLLMLPSSTRKNFGGKRVSDNYVIKQTKREIIENGKKRTIIDRVPTYAPKSNVLDSELVNSGLKVENSKKGFSLLPSKYKSKITGSVNQSSAETLQDYLKTITPETRKLFTPDEIATAGERARKAAGFIESPAYRAGRGLAEEGQNVEIGKFFEQVNKNWAKDTAEKGLKQIPSSKSYGKLADKYVPDYIYQDIVGMGGIRPGDAGTWGKFLKLYDKATSVWKAGKTVLSPSQLTRNTISNPILNYMAGGPGTLRTAIPGWKSALTKDAAYQEAKKVGTFAGDFTKTDIEKLLPSTSTDGVLRKSLEKIKAGWNKAVDIGGGIQNKTEEAGKMAQFILQRSKGKTPEEARALAEKALFNYGDLTPFEKNVIKRIIPFYTFTRKALPLVAETAVKHPNRLTVFKKAETAINNMTPERTGQNRMLPSYLKDAVRIPGTKNKYFNAQYIYPWGGMLGESNLPLGVNIPAYDLASKVISGYDPYYESTLTDSPLKSDMTKAKIDAVGRTLLPAAIAKNIPKPNTVTAEKSLGDNLLGQFGLGVYNLDIAKATSQQQYQINDLKAKTTSQIKKAATNMTDARARDNRIKRLQKNFQEEVKKILGEE